ncbi:MAG: S1/P1 nuclease [Acidobacteria bacterium]|nr:S1/P1 nuclease [Acidobacteriota bacterium]
MRARCVAVSSLALALAPAAAFAWGPVGHRVVARIAEFHLSPAAARGVAAILGAESLVEAATWPDEIRSDPAWNRAKPWHFVSLDDNETYETAPKSPDGDVVEAIGRFRGVLQDPAAAAGSKAEALRFLVHFVGDVHQPLHVGRRGDVGGNSIQVSWFGESTNLHEVWDEKIIEAEKLSFSELAELIDHPTETEIKTWQGTGVLDWVKESMAVRARVYEIGDKKLGYLYAYQNAPLVKRRLLQAGVRLAGVLNALFDSPGPSIPDRPPIGSPAGTPAASR